MKNLSFNEFKKDMERIHKMVGSHKNVLPSQARKNDSPQSEAPVPDRQRQIEWKQIWSFARKIFHRPTPVSTLQPSDDLVRLLQVMNDEPRIYHLFMFLAASPLDNRRAMLQKLAAQIQAETHDSEFVLMVHQLQDPQIFEATHRTIQKIKGERK